MTNLSLKQMQDLNLHGFFNDREKEKHIQANLSLQSTLINEPIKKEDITLEDILVRGGEFVYLFEGKKIRLSVLTPCDLNLLDNVDNFIQEGIEYDLLPVYKFHCKTALDNKLFIKAQTYQQAQAVVDSIFSVGQYKISASKI